ncbi:MAG TPA: hypothetical protein DHU96_27770 [Actinobacteria bacterium]|nr:hypothetical protein [Actinomycetota bacterium]
MMRVLVTGGAGFVGSNIVDALVARGDLAVALDDLSTGERGNLAPDIPLRVADVSDYDALFSAIHGEGFDAIVHCAAGKDRTGVVVALALSAVGVRQQAVIADYAASGDRLGPLLGRLRRSPTYSSDVNSKPARSQRPRPETMAAFLEQMDSRYSGAARWLTDHDFSQDDLRLLRAKLLRP